MFDTIDYVRAPVLFINQSGKNDIKIGQVNILNGYNTWGCSQVIFRADAWLVVGRHSSNTSADARPKVRVPAARFDTLDSAAYGGGHLWDGSITIASD